MIHESTYVFSSNDQLCEKHKYIIVFKLNNNVIRKNNNNKRKYVETEKQ